jgi:hypothetical protein
MYFILMSYRFDFIHTRIRLGACALNYYLFKIDCKLSPKCTCGFEIETINHYFLHCPIFAAQRLKLHAHLCCSHFCWKMACIVQFTNNKAFFCLDPHYFLRMKIFKYFTTRPKETKRFHTQDIWICLQFIFQYFFVCFSSISIAFLSTVCKCEVSPLRSRWATSSSWGKLPV